MRLDLTRAELEVIVNCLKGSPLKCEQKLRAQLTQQLDWQLHPSKAPDTNGWAPMKAKVSIRSSWPSGHVKQDRKSHWSYKGKGKKPTEPKVPKKPPTADDILASL